MEINFEGKRAIVTGAGRGIGREIATALSQAGAKTYALSLLQTELDSLKADVPDIVPVCLDLTNWQDTQAKVSEIGPVDLLVNNAGIARFVSFFETSENDCDATFAINVKAILAVSQVVARGMIEHKIKGSIVNISSISAAIGSAYTAYSASKGAVEQLTRCMAVELGPHAIRVNAVRPTTTLGSGLVTEEMARFGEAHLDGLLQRTPLGRFGQLCDPCNAVIYLLSDKAQMINGAFLPVDGGLLCT